MPSLIMVPVDYTLSKQLNLAFPVGFESYIYISQILHSWYYITKMLGSSTGRSH